MKTFIFTLTLFVSTLLCHAQKNIIEIDVESNIYKMSTTKKPGKYIISLLNFDSEKIYEININQEYHRYKPLSLPKTDSLNNIFEAFSNAKTIDTINLTKNQDLIIDIIVYNIKVESDGKQNIIKEKEYNYSYKTERKGSWQTTFGFNFIHLSKNDTYFSKSIDSTYVITESTNQNKYDFHPTIMFTWQPNNNNTFNVGLSGGLGYDLEKSLSVFSGLSLIYSQNITFTVGLAFHNQKKLNSNYKEKDILKENLTFEQLHGDFIRINPFVSLSFRLDKSPF